MMDAPREQILKSVVFMVKSSQRCLAFLDSVSSVDAADGQRLNCFKVF